MAKTLIGTVDDFPDNSCKAIQRGRKKVLIWRSGTKFYGTQENCPHQGASLDCEKLTGTMIPSHPKNLEYGMDGLIVRCPWHKWEYSVATGESVFETDNGKLKTYSVDVENGLVYINF